MKYIRWFDTLRMKDVPLVGGKNASLGQMMHAFKNTDICIPNGFAVTSAAYWHYIDSNDLRKPLQAIMRILPKKYTIKQLQAVGKKIRHAIEKAIMPEDLERDICAAYDNLKKEYKGAVLDVAVRSSATAEDLPTASFAGQQETFLNVRGHNALITACKKSLASLFTDRAISYRIANGFDHFDVALSIGVQKMVRSDSGSAGVAFSLDTESGFKDVVVIDSSWGLGESIVQGVVNPDGFTVFKPTLEQGYKPIIAKKLGQKKYKLVYNSRGKNAIKKIASTLKEQNSFSLSDDEVLNLSRMVIKIESYYTKMNGHWTPMDVEWARDGQDNKMYIVQARPETVHAQKGDAFVYKTYALKNSEKPVIVTRGQSVGQSIVSGVARIIKNTRDLKNVQKGDILVTKMTNPDWVPVMKKAAGIVTDLGGRTCHAAIVARELGTVAVVGTHNATKAIKHGQSITIDCSQGAQGLIYNGLVPFTVKEIDGSKLPKPQVPLYVNSAEPSRAFPLSRLPVSGVGLARIEFIITNNVQVHPMALLHPEKVKDIRVRARIKKITRAYGSKEVFFTHTLAQGVGMIAAAFYPRPVIVRLSDFKTNEYRDLIGGEFFEPEEANPMLGFRGASRYTSPLYAEAFALECKALHMVRETMGLDNVKVMVPFVRTVPEAESVVKAMGKHGLNRGKDGLEFVMMCEVPSNVLLIDQFSKLFDGFSIGSNDLTQLTLGVDRDSALLAAVFDERDPAVKKMFEMAIKGAHKNKRFIGICGQAPSDYPELAHFLAGEGISSISLNADSVVSFLLTQGNALESTL